MYRFFQFLFFTLGNGLLTIYQICIKLLTKIKIYMHFTSDNYVEYQNYNDSLKFKKMFLLMLFIDLYK